MVRTKYVIQDAARELFRESGYDNVTIEDICANAGITKSTFYYHFSSKSDLLTDFFKGAGREDTDVMARIVAEDDYWEQLWLCLEQAPKMIMNTGKNLISQLLMHSLQSETRIFNYQNRPNAVALHCSIIKRGQSVGRFMNPNPPEEIYEAISQILYGTLYEWCVSKNDEYDTERYKKLVQLVLELK